MRLKHFLSLLLVSIVLAGCSSTTRRAPVVEQSEASHRQSTLVGETRKNQAREQDWRPQVYVVQKGDTLYSIAFNYGFDYHELAAMNNIQDPSVIQIGQQIRLFPNATIRPATVVESKPILAIKDQPKLAKYAYSEAAEAQIGKVQEVKPDNVVAKAEPKAEAKPEPKQAETNDSNVEADTLDWSMPTQGKVISGFSESDNRKGIDIGGQLGQPIYASAPGKVVYSGSGLRGYGKLIIIKHNNTYLSAYAHNDQLLVKEGQSITRGQKIAEMGKSDTDQVKLHFEVRRFGKPVDPAKYLPLGKS